MFATREGAYRADTAGLASRITTTNSCDAVSGIVATNAARMTVAACHWVAPIQRTPVRVRKAEGMHQLGRRGQTPTSVLIVLGAHIITQ